MSEELQKLLLEIGYAVVPIIGSILVAYFGGKGWKGWVIRKIIESVVDSIAENQVAQAKAVTEAETGKYDLTPIQARAAMYTAKQAVKLEVAKKDAELPPILRPVLSVSKSLPPEVPLQQKIEEAVQERKLKRLQGPRRLGKGR